MASINDLKAGSYRGIQFFYQGTSETRGFKNAVHEYPGSDNFVIEQLGKRTQQFNMDIRIRFEDKESFDIALNTPGTGILVHPNYGNFLVKVIEYTKTDSVNEIGLFNYSVQFVVEVGLVIPSAQGITTAVISRLRSEAVTKASEFAQSKLKGLGL
jgi:prophage DNA circulation protein